MVSLEAAQAMSMEAAVSSSPRVSFSAEFLDDDNFISITPNPEIQKLMEMEREKARNPDFEFLFNNDSSTDSMLTADELFFEGKLLPCWEIEKLNKMSIKPKEEAVIFVDGEEKEEERKEEMSNKMSWFIDEDPSPRPPKCTVLWKELLRLKKQRASSSVLSPSSSSSSSSLMEVEGSSWNREKHVKRIKKGLERTRSASIRIRPVVNVPIYTTQGKSGVLPPLFSLRKSNVER